MTAIPSPDPKFSIAADGSELRCPACDYDLRALQSDRCPECGLLLDRAGMAVSQIPWTHRREMGRVRAFRKTCWLMFRRPSRAAASAARPVSFSDARRFQRAVIVVTYLPLLALVLWAFFANVDGRLFRQSGISGMTALPWRPPQREIPAPGRWLGWTMEWIGLAVAAVCLWLFLKAIPGVASYFFHPRDLPTPRQNRAIALSYYACGPLAWTPISLALFISLFVFSNSRWADGSSGWQVIVVLSVLTFLSAAVQLAGWWRCTLVLLKHATRCGGGRVLVAAISLPLLWAICAVLILGVLPAAYLFVCVVILSSL